MGKQVYNYTALLNNFSENMKRRRLKLGLRQKELAEIVGVSIKTIQNYENKKTIPTSAIMEKIVLSLELDEKLMLLPVSENSINYINEFEKIDIEKINYLVMNINFSIEELNKELSKLKLIE